MTFDPSTLDLDLEHLNDLATFIHDIDMVYLPFTGAEVKAMFEFPQPAKDFHEFEWNVRGSFIAGTVDGTHQIVSPNELLKEQPENNTWFEYAATTAILDYIRKRLGDLTLMNKIQISLEQRFEYLSQGQAKSVLKRFLGMTLTSAERNDIYRLRKKIEGYQQLVDAFADKLAVNRSRPDPYVDHRPSDHLPTPDELIASTSGKLAFMCWECKEYQPFPEGSYINPPLHHGRPMSLNWNMANPEYTTQAHRELASALSAPDHNLVSIDSKPRTPSKIPEGFPKLFCSTCNQYFDIDDELQQRLDQSEHRISLPKHHGSEMQILTGPVGGTKKLQEIMEKLKLLGDDRAPGLYYVCNECLLITHASDVSKSEVSEMEAPMHHGKKMNPLFLEDKFN